MLCVAHLLYQAKHNKRYGLHTPSATFEWRDVQDWVQKVIKRLRGGTLKEAYTMLTRRGIDLLHGQATFVAPNEVFITGRAISATHIILATGSEAVVPSIEGLKEAGYITNIQAVAFPTLPHSLAIIGGGLSV